MQILNVKNIPLELEKYLSQLLYLQMIWINLKIRFIKE